MPESEKLLACPFCGGEPRFLARGSHETETGKYFAYSCACGGHSARAHQWGDTQESAMKKWNTRADDPRGDDAVIDEAVSAIYRQFKDWSGRT